MGGYKGNSASQVMAVRDKLERKIAQQERQSKKLYSDISGIKKAIKSLKKSLKTR